MFGVYLIDICLLFDDDMTLTCDWLQVRGELQQSRQSRDQLNVDCSLYGQLLVIRRTNACVSVETVHWWNVSE